jgi:hypothetical protein
VLQDICSSEEMPVDLMPALIGLDSEGGIVHIETPRKDETWFFLGDIHGDPECLKWTFRGFSPLPAW